ncbi:uncharacterized protein PV09_03874 [Verruconis gallopava]|uniref:AB hydrolase-1 domain-containing protein n=1 Tax=Verruconis gallopava TaxID=253628 RepID=A0A0D2AED6_9PEZI|nr:uncharacterized protein PV09_03874 [Verruconis gallopava]KIW05358.1 hypothetical protein PV09_03874 [Verruconis gallopava]
MSSSLVASRTGGLEIAYARLSPSPRAGDVESSPPTIIFLHGSESCHLEFSRVAQFLKDDYEILLVDLPGHSRSKAIPFSFDNAIGGILNLVRTQVSGSKVHLVGLSLGGFISLEFARRHPENVLSVWCTGCAPFSGFGLWLRSQSRLLSALICTAGRLVPESVFWASLGARLDPIPGFRAEVRSNQTMDMLRPMFDELVSITLDDLARIRGVRVAIVAGGRHDSVEDTIKAGRVLQSGNPECAAFVVRQAIHWWSLQFPEEFAAGIRAWIERREMPKIYEPLLAPAS